MSGFSRSFHFSAVYIVQYLDERDTEKTGRQLYEFLEPFSRAAGVRLKFFNAETNDEFMSALGAVVADCNASGSGPVLHLETHGTKDGIGPKLDPLIPWSSLGPVLTELNILSRMNLIVTMAACHGLNIVRTLLPQAQSPMWGLVGPDEMVLPSDIRSCFRAFYRTLVNELDLNAALRSLREADSSWPDTWKFQNAELFLSAVYGDYLATLTSPEALALRENRFVTNGFARGVPRSGEESMRQFYRTMVGDEHAIFERIKDHFLMLNEFPENRSRFPLSLDEVKRHRTLRTPAANTNAPCCWLTQCCS